MSQLALDALTERFGDAVLETLSSRGDDIAIVDKGQIVEVARFLRTDDRLQFNMLVDLFGIDRLNLPDARARFEVVYQFYSAGRKRHRVWVKCPVDEADPVIASITGVWPGADWYERECWDMFGIRFEGHPNLRRILMYEEFEGHPLRKDYRQRGRQPLIGTPH